MLTRKGFTLVELMVVILIVAILAAVAIPIMRGRIDSAKWTEGKAMAGTIATAIRAYYAEKAEDGVINPTKEDLGFLPGDLDATYFREADGAFTWTTAYTPGTNVLTFTIFITAPPSIGSPDTMTLDQAGAWTDTTGSGV